MFLHFAVSWCWGWSRQGEGQSKQISAKLLGCNWTAALQSGSSLKATQSHNASNPVTQILSTDISISFISIYFGAGTFQILAFPLSLTNVLCFSMANLLLAEIIIYKILPQNKPQPFCFLVVPQRSWNAARGADSKGNSERNSRGISEMMWRWGKAEYQTRYPWLHRRLENRSRT